MAYTYTIHDRDTFDALRVEVDIHKDHIAVTFHRDGQICTIESWGEHGAHDFAELGITIINQ
jgi:hypothetical protein